MGAPSIEEKEEEQHMADIISLDGRKLIQTGGKSPPTDNWLGGMKTGTIFICEINQDMGLQTAIQQEYQIERKDGNSVLLMANLNEPVVLARVNPERFCKYYNLVEVIFEPKEEQENADY